MSFEVGSRIGTTKCVQRFIFLPGIAVNQATAVLGLFFGPLADRFGHRRMMEAGLWMLTVGMLAAACLPFYAVVMVALLSTPSFRV